MFRLSLILIIWISLASNALGSDQLREQLYAQEIKESLVAGKATLLKAGDQEFLSIHGESDSKKLKGGVILLHGMGGNPAWSVVVQPLRLGLTNHGWETLSLQMPVAPKGADVWAYDALIPEAAPRISAGIEFLKQRKVEKIVIVGHSMGARMGLEAVATAVPDGVIALVLVGVPTSVVKTDTGTLGSINKLKLPLLDIYGSSDFPSVLDTAKARKIAARQAGNEGYRQVMVDGAGHMFQGLEDDLLAKINAWISREAEQSKIISKSADPAAPDNNQ